MAKYHKIRWHDSDEQELKRVVRNFNAKVTRLAKKNPQIKNVLPEKVTVAQLKELINTRQDLKRELNKLRRFSKRGSEQIITVPDTDYNPQITKWQYTEMKRMAGIINRKRTIRLKQIQELEMTSRGEPLGYTREQFGMGTIQEASLRPVKAFTRRMEQYDIKWKWKSLQTESQSSYFTESDYRLRDNYIQGIKTHYDYESVKDIIAKIEGMDIGEFMKTFNEEGATFEIPSPDEFTEPGVDIKYEEYLSWENALRSIWMRK